MLLIFPQSFFPSLHIKPQSRTDKPLASQVAISNNGRFLQSPQPPLPQIAHLPLPPAPPLPRCPPSRPPCRRRRRLRPDRTGRFNRHHQPGYGPRQRPLLQVGIQRPDRCRRGRAGGIPPAAFPAGGVEGRSYPGVPEEEVLREHPGGEEAQAARGRPQESEEVNISFSLSPSKLVYFCLYILQ